MRIRRALRWIFTITAIVFASYFLSAALGGAVSFQADDGGAPSGPETRQVLLVSGPIHYDLLLPLDDTTRTRFALLGPHGIDVANPDAHWLIIGWGAHDFYTTAGTYADVTFSAVWRGLTGDSSVLRADTIGPLAPNHGLASISFDAAQYDRLLAAIDKSFATGPNGQPIAITAAGFTQTDRFFAAKGRFHILRTCNTWISNVLRASGKRFGIWTPTPYAVTLSLHRFHPQ